MPKKVDHEERRRTIATALWRMAARQGLDNVSLRDVATEAGISLGQLQHYFASRDALLTYASDHLGDLASQRIQQRLAETPPDGPPPPRRVLTECARVMLPLDEESRAGLLVQLAYFSRAVREPRMREPARRGVPALVALFGSLLSQGVDAGEVDPALDVEAEAMLLLAEIDGLGSYTLLEVLTPQRAFALFERRIAALFGYRGPSSE